MPISITCGQCDSTFRARDEHAGRRAKCPICQTVCVIPGSRINSTPVVKAKASAPQVIVGDDGAVDEPVRPKKRTRASDSDDELPRSKRSARDDDKPRKKKKKQEKSSPLPLILGLCGGVLALIVVGLGIAWAAGAFGDKKPSSTNPSTTTTTPAVNPNSTQPVPKVSEPTKPPLKPVATVTVEELAANPDQYRGKVVQVRGILAVKPFSQGGRTDSTSNKYEPFYRISLVGPKEPLETTCYESVLKWTSPPNKGDAVEFVGTFTTTREFLFLGADAILVKHIPVLDPSKQIPDIEMTAVELAEEIQKSFKDRMTKYQGKVVKITGTVIDVISQNELYIGFERVVKPNTRPGGFPCILWADRSALDYKKNQRVTVIGTIDFIKDGKFLSLKNCVVNPE
jgi:hypothetical protein